MSRRSAAALRLDEVAPVFAALGDPTRLKLVAKLSGGAPRSIAQLSEDHTVTRQAVTKHLRVLEGAGLVRGVRQGRESRFALEPQALAGARQALDQIAQQWNDALLRLKAFVES
jgi:DNA-binding transcriptional ArsR family regulator